MQIIVTHDLADFDAFASAVAAQKLHPEAQLVMGPRLGRNVREFLALHKDRFSFIRAADVDQSAVRHLIVVDVRRRGRLPEVGELLRRVDAEDPTLRVTVWDHHRAAPDDLAADEEVVARVGSATTLLVEAMRAGAVAIDALEATLFALGIHTDTGSLVHGTSTARDARALAWLMDQGASLAVINRYLSAPMTEAQRGALSAVLAAAEVHRVGRLEVCFALVELAADVDGIDIVTSEALSLLGHHALFALFYVKSKAVQVVGRARSDWIDVGAALGRIGGGGHPSAGAARVKGTEPLAVRAAILSALAEDPPMPRLVRDVMSSPVHAVAPELPLFELQQSLRTWQHTGVPVVRQGELVGIISRRDVEKAARDGRLALPVGSCMASTVHTTTEQASLEAALELMTERDVGRLPVLRRGRVVGILSRTDALRFLYDE